LEKEVPDKKFLLFLPGTYFLSLATVFSNEKALSA